MSVSKDFIERYSRQMLVPELGLASQLAFKESRVLIIGAGGLGCPVALYLAAAGVGFLRVCDADTVEASNLPRQILHRESTLGANKARSIASACADLNSGVVVEVIEALVGVDNVLDLMEDVEVVVDATDNVVTRYLINDAAAVKKVPLVSGAALGWDGQVSVFMFDQRSPCYRCLYPKPPPAASITNCDLAGVVGPVTGIIGSLQALQVLRILAKLPPACTDSLLTFSGNDCDKMFRQLRLRTWNPNCIACGQNPSILLDGKLTLNYVHFCGGLGQLDKNPDLNLLDPQDRINCQQLKEHLLLLSKEPKNNLLIVDVRPSNQWAFCSLPQSTTFIPIDDFMKLSGDDLKARLNLNDQITEIVFVCRRGNDSQLAVQKCKELNWPVKVRDLIGGLRAWAQNIDPEMPIY